MALDMKVAGANGIDVAYEDRGPADGVPLLLVNGYGSTMMNWPVELLDGLRAKGFRVIRFDNRDVGRSAKLSGLPDIGAIMAAVREGHRPEIPYTLSDMGGDGIGLLDALGIPHAHVVGVSMGGMIVQRMAIDHPDRLISVTSIMSTTGNPDLPRASEAAMKALQQRPASDERETVIRHRMNARRVFESPAYPMSDEALYARLAGEFDHMYYPEGTIRQYAAIGCDGSRVESLKEVQVPFLVIHGKADPLVPVEGGIDTAKAVPGAKLELFDGMGHDLPVELCPRFVELIAAHAGAAARKAAAE